MADLLALASAKLGQTVDMDGAYGGQCMDLIVYVVKTAYGVHMGGNAIDTGNAGNIAALQKAGVKVQRITNRSQLKRGDIVVFSDGGYGHVAIVEEPTHPTLVQQNMNGRQYVTRDSFAWSEYIGLSFAYGLRLGESTPDPDPTPNKGEIDMYLIFTIDTKNWYVTNGVQCKWIKNERFLKNFQNDFGKLNLPVDEMYSTELYAEFPKSQIIQ